MRKYIGKQDVLKHLRSMAKSLGSQKALAEHLQISPQHLGDILKENRELSDTVLTKLGMRKVVMYDRI